MWLMNRAQLLLWIEQVRTLEMCATVHEHLGPVLACLRQCFFLIYSVTTPTSNFLEIGSQLYLNGTDINVRCVFKQGIEEASCALVYREYGNETLVVKEYPQNSTVFPVTLTIGDDLEKYTFAIFGKSSSGIDGRPIVFKQFPTTTAQPTSSPTVEPTETVTG